MELKKVFIRLHFLHFPLLLLLEDKSDESSNNTTIEPKKIFFSGNDKPAIKQSKDQIKNTIQTKTILSSTKQENLSTNTTKEKVLSFEDLIY